MRVLPILLTLGLSLVACSPAPPLPEDPDVDVNGVFSGRLVGADNRSVLLDVTIVEKDRAVTATAVNAETGETLLALKGSRSPYRNSPVGVNAVAERTEPGAPCERGVAERFSVDLNFYSRTGSRAEGATGSVSHEFCDAETRLFRPVNDGSGRLELVRP